MSTRQFEDEVIDRLRRMETRMMKYYESVGFDAKGTKPIFRRGRLIAPSPDTSLSECAKAVPLGWSRPVPVFVGETYITTIATDEPQP